MENCKLYKENCTLRSHCKYTMHTKTYTITRQGIPVDKDPPILNSPPCKMHNFQRIFSLSKQFIIQVQQLSCSGQVSDVVRDCIRGSVEGSRADTRSRIGTWEGLEQASVSYQLFQFLASIARSQEQTRTIWSGAGKCVCYQLIQFLACNSLEVMTAYFGNSKNYSSSSPLTLGYVLKLLCSNICCSSAVQ